MTNTDDEPKIPVKAFIKEMLASAESQELDKGEPLFTKAEILEALGLEEGASIPASETEKYTRLDSFFNDVLTNVLQRTSYPHDNKAQLTYIVATHGSRRAKLLDNLLDLQETFFGLKFHSNIFYADTENITHSIAKPAIVITYNKEKEEMRLLHRHAKAINMALMNMAARNGISIAYRSSGLDDESQRNIQRIRNAGYTSTAIILGAPLETKQSDATERFREREHRFKDPEHMQTEIARQHDELSAQIGDILRGAEQVRIFWWDKDPKNPVEAMRYNGPGHEWEILDIAAAQAFCAEHGLDIHNIPKPGSMLPQGYDELDGPA